MTKRFVDERNPRSMLLPYTTLCHQHTVPLKLLEVLRQGDRYRRYNHGHGLRESNCSIFLPLREKQAVVKLSDHLLPSNTKPSEKTGSNFAEGIPSFFIRRASLSEGMSVIVYD